mgnify:CR=1 FL=1
MITISFYDTKPYDREYFNLINEQYGFTINYFETKLSARTAKLAEGSDAVCAFVNDDVSASAIDALDKIGVRLIAMRCAGYNNVDILYADGKIFRRHMAVISEEKMYVFHYGLLRRRRRLRSFL